MTSRKRLLISNPKTLDGQEWLEVPPQAWDVGGGDCGYGDDDHGREQNSPCPYSSAWESHSLPLLLLLLWELPEQRSA